MPAGTGAILPNSSIHVIHAANAKDSAPAITETYPVEIPASCLSGEFGMVGGNLIQFHYITSIIAGYWLPACHDLLITIPG